MVFIELARVSEIPAPHKFDRSISGNFRSIDFPAILNFQLFMYFHLKITIFLLMSCKLRGPNIHFLALINTRKIYVKKNATHTLK
jgi:hypothetical protein